MSEITPNTPNPVREDSYTEELATKLGIDPKFIPKSPVWRNEEEIAALAEMFANMSGSSGGGVLVVHMVYNEELDNDYSDKTWKEIRDADVAFISQDVEGIVNYKSVGLVNYMSITGDGTYVLSFVDYHGNTVQLVTDSENGYLTWAE